MSGRETQREIVSSDVIPVLPAMKLLFLMCTLSIALPNALPQGRQVWVFLPLLQMRSLRLEEVKCLPGLSSLWNKDNPTEGPDPSGREEPLGQRADSGPSPLSRTFHIGALLICIRGTLGSELISPQSHRVLLDGHPTLSNNPTAHMVSCPQGEALSPAPHHVLVPLPTPNKKRG